MFLDSLAAHFANMQTPLAACWVSALIASSKALSLSVTTMQQDSYLAPCIGAHWGTATRLQTLDHKRRWLECNSMILGFLNLC